ncbi:MAG: macro domain-containing protein [Clostridia bacterium]|nr:macro domain-containing protein [Clostridia bacterium]
MPLLFVRNDITKMKCDAIVNAVDNDMHPGGGTDAAIHKAAGPGLLEECMSLGGCPSGMAKITGAYDLKCKYVIHTAGPRWRGGSAGEEETLVSCCRNSLRLASENGCMSVAFPLISTGTFGYPKDLALKTMQNAIADFLTENDMTVYIVVYDKEGFLASKKLSGEIREYIDENYVEKHLEKRSYHQRRNPFGALPGFFSSKSRETFEAEDAAFSVAGSLDDIVDELDESFSQMLLRKITEKGMTDPECYKRANVDRKLFSKIRNDVNYRPKKTTAVAFAVALRLSLDETRELLMKAGFALSHSSKFDVIVEYFISRGIYDIFTINEALFEYDQALLGA